LEGEPLPKHLREDAGRQRAGGDTNPACQRRRLRTGASRRFKKTENAEAMIWKLLTVAEQSWRKLNAPELMQDVYHGTRFKDGIAVQTKTESTRKAA
jgi:hypothetical protein